MAPPLGTLTPSPFPPACLPFVCVFPGLNSSQKVLLFSSTIGALQVLGVAGGAEQRPSHPACGHQQGLQISLSSRRVQFLSRQLFLLRRLTKEIGLCFESRVYGRLSEGKGQTSGFPRRREGATGRSGDAKSSVLQGCSSGNGALAAVGVYREHFT